MIQFYVSDVIFVLSQDVVFFTITFFICSNRQVLHAKETLIDEQEKAAEHIKGSLLPSMAWTNNATPPVSNVPL